MRNNRRASLVDHHHRKRDNGGNGDHSRNDPMPTAAGRSVYSCDGRAEHPPQAAGGHLRRTCLLDIRSRMLENRELIRAMGFDGEEQSCEFHGNKGEVTKQIGVAVPAHLAAARVRATLAPQL